MILTWVLRSESGKFRIQHNFPKISLQDQLFSYYFGREHVDLAEISILVGLNLKTNRKSVAKLAQPINKKNHTAGRINLETSKL